MAEEAPLPPVERDTLDLSLRSTPDPFLGDLMELAQHGTELAVGLLVNGMVVIGRLDRPEAIAQELSTMRRRLIDRSPQPEGHSDEQWAAVREGFTNAPLSYVAERQQAEAAIHEQLAEHAVEGVVNMDELPATLARQAREIATRSHITLTDARIAAPGQDGMTALPVMRVAVKHVTSWWFAMPDEEGRSNIELWSENRSEG
ncbi:MAG: hypothetical protein JHD16_15115 [Solirubrobacteraceae bacterium]|nr:hypothetical protein [Solirubrobacteraceae bacterium]